MNIHQCQLQGLGTICVAIQLRACPSLLPTRQRDYWSHWLQVLRKSRVATKFRKQLSCLRAPGLQVLQHCWPCFPSGRSSPSGRSRSCAELDRITSHELGIDLVEGFLVGGICRLEEQPPCRPCPVQNFLDTYRAIGSNEMEGCIWSDASLDQHTAWLQQAFNPLGVVHLTRIGFSMNIHQCQLQGLGIICV